MIWQGISTMPRLGRAGLSEFFGQTTAAADSGDASALADYLAANLDRLPRWAVQEAERVISNIGIAAGIRQSQAEEVPSDTSAVYSLVRFEIPSGIEGEPPEVRFRTIATREEIPGEGITMENVLADIETVLAAWSERYPEQSQDRPPEVTVAWTVATRESGPALTFPLGPQ